MTTASTFAGFYRESLDRARRRGTSLETVAATTKTWVTRSLLDPCTEAAMERGIAMLTIFGDHYAGDEVGHLGRDLVEPCLHHRHPAVRLTAVKVLQKWRREDSEGPWRTLLDSHLRNEEDPRVLDTMHEPEEKCGAELDEEVLDWCLGFPGWSYVSENASNYVQAEIANTSLPSFLERTIDLHPSVSLGLIEVARVGHPYLPSEAVQVHTVLINARRYVAAYTSTWCLTLAAHGDGWDVTIYF